MSQDRCGGVKSPAESTQERFPYFSGQITADRTALDRVDNINTGQTFPLKQRWFVKENEDNVSL